MTTPKYRVGEILDVTLPGVKVTSVSGAESGEIEVLLECPSGGLYRTDIPLNVAGIRRVTPTGGPPRPGEVWRDATNADWWACPDSLGGQGVRLTSADGTTRAWLSVHRDPQTGPITRVYPPAPDTTGGQADSTPEPRLMLGDIWEDGVGDPWKVTAEYGQLRLTYSGSRPHTWDEVTRDYGLPTLIERAGYRRTICTRPAERLRSGVVVSYPVWCDDAPVRLLTVQALAAGGVEVTYEPLGDDAVGTGTAGPDARITLWDEIAGGAR